MSNDRPPSFVAFLVDVVIVGAIMGLGFWVVQAIRLAFFMPIE